jgi:endo-1,4-beta-xylanase
VTVHLTAHDTFSGVGQTWYQVDGGPWQTGNTVVVLAPVSHCNDGLHTISYYSIDNAGNTEAGYKVCTVNIATR